MTCVCMDKGDDKEHACKSIPKRKLLCHEDYNNVWRDIRIMHYLLEYTNVVMIQGAYEDALFVHLVMELRAGGELFDKIIQNGHFSEREGTQLIKTIVGVAESCHSHGVTHIKQENFLFVSAAAAAADDAVQGHKFQSFSFLQAWREFS